MESWVDMMDGAQGVNQGFLSAVLELKDGKLSDFYNTLWFPMRSALDEYRVQQTIYTKEYSDLVGAVDFGNEEITANEFAMVSEESRAYKFGSESNGRGKVELLGAMLHTGNASNLKKLIPSDMQKMLKSIQSAMGIQGTPIKTNGSETESNLNKITKDIDKFTNTNGESDSSGGEGGKGAITQGGTTNNGLNMNNLQTMSSYDQFISTDFKSVFGRNMDMNTSNLSASTFNFSTSTEGLNIIPLDMKFNNILESDSSTSSNTKDLVILTKTNTEIVAVPVGGGSDGGDDMVVREEISRAFAEL